MPETNEQRLIDDYRELSVPSDVARDILREALSSKDWEFQDTKGGYKYRHGIMIHPDLACHRDWDNCISEWDGYYEEPISYYFDYIENLFNSPVFAGDNDWSDYIVEL